MTVMPKLLTWDDDVTHACFPHEWTIVDRTPEGAPRDDDWYLCVVCENCGGARCASCTPGGRLRCEMVRHHPTTTPHLYPDNTKREVGA